tara:strand:- start:855 stop:1064 length:210 start_codon:yes stop_codon:yes gene_type:complete
MISILLGLGLASLFRKVCTDKNCIQFDGPIINELEEKIYGHGNKCFQYKLKSDKCNSMKKIIKLNSQTE